MKFKVIKLGSASMAVNVDHIRFISDMGDGSTRIVMADGATFYSDESYKSLVARLNANTSGSGVM